ncbi:MAG: HAD-IIB family hydrolase [Oscillospiraceae bacterium]|nr:HAD-IIB family hydrolase [Oscillospiraceae bacterium]
MTNSLQSKTEKIRYILFDLDGTLFGAHHTLDAETVPLLTELMARGYRVSVATGRSLATLSPYFDPYGLRFNAPAVGSAGAEVGLVGDTSASRVHLHTFANDTLLEILQYLTANGDVFCNDGIGHVFVSESMGDNTYLHMEQRETRAQGYFYPDIISIGSSELQRMCDGSVLKLMVWYNSDAQRDRIFRYLETRSDVHGFTPGFSMVEMLPAGVDKALGISIAAAQLGLSVENCCVFGDSGNDVAMLRAAGLSVAMCNGSDDAKAASDLVTRLPNTEQGAVRMALELFPPLT